MIDPHLRKNTLAEMRAQGLRVAAAAERTRYDPPRSGSIGLNCGQPGRYESPEPGERGFHDRHQVAPNHDRDLGPAAPSDRPFREYQLFQELHDWIQAVLVVLVGRDDLKIRKQADLMLS